MGVLHGKTALITGAASGIGRAIAVAYLGEGARVVAADLDLPGLAGLAEEHPGISTVKLDVTQPDSARQAVETALSLGGGLDIAVNSHGILTQSPLEKMSIQTWQQTIDVDLTGVFTMMQAEAEPMLAAGSGRIVNIASQLAIKGGIDTAHYVAAKAGVIGLTKSAALEWAPRGVLVNCIAPGPVWTPLVTEGLSEQWQKAKAAELPLGRFGVPEEIAPTAVLLASEVGGALFVGQTLGPNSGDVMP